MDILRVCRLCSKTAPNKGSLFYKGYASEVNDFFKIRLKKIPKLSDKICAGCSIFLDDVREFKNKISFTQAHFQQIISKQDDPAADPYPETDLEDHELLDELLEDHSEHEDSFEWPYEGFSEEGDSKPEEETIPLTEEDTIEEPLENVLEEDAPSPPPESTVEPRKKRSCVRLRESLIEYSGPGSKLKLKDDGDGPDWKPGSNPKKVKPVNKGLRVFRPKEVVRAEKIVLARKRRIRLAQEKKKEKAHKPLERLMKELGVLECPICHMPQDTFDAIGVHFKEQHQLPMSSRYIMCCDQKQTLNRVHDHMRYHRKNDAFKCKDCGELCLSGKALQKHALERHEIKGDQPFACPVCPQRYSKEQYLNYHLKRLHRPLTGVECEECGIMVMPYALKSHIKDSHQAADTKYNCHICGKTFVHKNSFKIHMKLHETGPQRNECDICNKMFADVAKHKDRAHNVNGLVYVDCPECQKKCKSTNLKRHIELNHKFTLVKCTICEKEFKNKDRLRMHMDIHLGIRYPCHFCLETYGNSSNRLKHMQRKHAADYEQYKIEQEKLREQILYTDKRI